MAEPASLPLDPAVLETEVFGTIVARLVAGFASLASSPTRTSVAWSQVRVSVNLTRRVPEGDSPPPVGRESYRVSVEATPGRGIAPGDTSVAAFISRLFVGGEHAVLLPEQVGDVYLATATRGENVVRTYEWRGRFGRAWHRMDVFDPRDSQAAATPQQRRAGPNQEPDDASRLMERARRETRPKSAAGLLPNHAFTTAAFTWTPSAGVVVLFADPNPARGALGSQAPAGSASLILSNTVDAVERQVECLPVECQVDVTVSDPTSARAIGRRITATRGPSPPSVHNEIREHKLTFRGVAQGPPGTGRGSTEGWTATVAVSLVTVDDADVANVVKVCHAFPNPPHTVYRPVRDYLTRTTGNSYWRTCNSYKLQIQHKRTVTCVLWSTVGKSGTTTELPNPGYTRYEVLPIVQSNYSYTSQED
jgi:hypothetical protein